MDSQLMQPSICPVWDMMAEGQTGQPRHLFFRNMLQLVGSQIIPGPAGTCNHTMGPGCLQWSPPSKPWLEHCWRDDAQATSFPSIRCGGAAGQYWAPPEFAELLAQSDKQTAATLQTDLISVSCSCDPTFMASKLVTEVSEPRLTSELRALLSNGQLPSPAGAEPASVQISDLWPALNLPLP